MIYKKKVTFYNRWLLNKGDRMGKFDYGVVSDVDWYLSYDFNQIMSEFVYIERG